MTGPTEDQLLGPVRYLTIPELSEKLEALALQVARVLELQETLLGIATGEVQVFHGQVDIVGEDGLWPPAEPTP